MWFDIPTDGTMTFKREYKELTDYYLCADQCFTEKQISNMSTTVDGAPQYIIISQRVSHADYCDVHNCMRVTYQIDNRTV